MMIFGIMGGETVGFKTSLLQTHHLTVVLWQLLVYLWQLVSFQGTELLGVAAGETSGSRSAIFLLPTYQAYSLILRHSRFSLSTIIFIQLSLAASDVTVSPFTLIF